LFANHGTDRVTAEGSVCHKDCRDGAEGEVCDREIAIKTEVGWYALQKYDQTLSLAPKKEGLLRCMEPPTLTMPAKPMALATAAVTKYAAERPPRRLMVLTVQGSKDPSHSLSESLRRERQRVKSWMARIELKRAPMKEVAKTIVLFQRGMMEERKVREREEKRDEGMETRPFGTRPKRKRYCIDD